MRLFAVRHIEDKQAVALVAADSLRVVVDYVDLATDPELCEYIEIQDSGAFIWDSEAPTFGNGRDEIEEYDEVRSLKMGMDPEGSFHRPFYDHIPAVEWKVLLPGDQPRTDGEWARLREKRRRADVKAEKEAAALAAAAVPGPSLPTLTTNVYFIGCDDHVKIGMAGSVEKRFRALATSHHRELTLLAVIKGASGSLEFELHERFAAHRVRGEWFRLAPDIQAYIDEIKAREP